MSDLDESRIMGIDFGMKRIGIALSDLLKMFAYAHKTILNNSSTLLELEKIVKEKNVTKFILGIPHEERQKKNKDLLDMYSAAIILQEYLDSVKRNNWSDLIDFA